MVKLRILAAAMLWIGAAGAWASAIEDLGEENGSSGNRP